MTRADFLRSIRRAAPGVVAATIVMTGPTLAQQAGADFPAGAGKDDVVAVCGGCHDINRLKAGYTADGWRTVMRMMQNFGAPLAADHATTVTDYLIKSFPEGPRPEAALIEGPADIAIKEWPVATPGSRPHDPLAARDGSIWYTGQRQRARAA